MSNPALTSIAKSATFTPSGGSAWNFTDLMDLDDGESASTVDVTTDNAVTVNGMFVDSIKGDISITCSDFEHTTNAGAVIGSTGSLVVRYDRRAQGKGAVSSHTLSVTYANAQVRDIKRRAGVTGTGTITVSFGAYDPAGLTVKSAAVA